MATTLPLLYEVCRDGDYKMAEWLLEKGADVTDGYKYQVICTIAFACFIVIFIVIFIVMFYNMY